MTQLTDKAYAVEVPDDAQDILIKPHMDEGKLIWFDYRGAGNWAVIPHTNFDFLFTTKTATEEDARKVVRELPVGARFENYAGDYPVWYHTGKESLASLLRSKGLDENKNYVLIEKQTNG